MSIFRKKSTSERIQRPLAERIKELIRQKEAGVDVSSGLRERLKKRIQEEEKRDDNVNAEEREKEARKRAEDELVRERKKRQHAEVRQREAEEARKRAEERADENPINKFYHALGLQPGASPEQIKMAQRFLLIKLHPDCEATNEDHRKIAEEKAKEINEAYQELRKYLRF